MTEEPQPQPEMTDAQKIEAGIKFWRKAAADTATIVRLYQESGFSRDEAIRLTILAITGREIQK